MDTHYIRHEARGITLLRSLLIAGSVVVVLGIIFLLIDPAARLAAARDAERTDAANAVLSAVLKFAAENGGRAPAGIVALTPGAARQIGSAASGCAVSCGAVELGETCVDLSADLVGTYLAALPVDPKHGTPEQTGYFVSKDAQGRVTVGACTPEQTASIQFTR